MEKRLPPYYALSTEVMRARTLDLPIVALESTVITHGLPFPENFNVAREVENEVRGQGAVPATVSVIEGRVHVGANDMHLEYLARTEAMLKISTRDLAPAIVFRRSGGTTVAGTMAAAYPVGIRVFATGGIGGVHRSVPAENNPSQDVSTDLTELARTQMVVVCAGAKAILDLPATIEVLETLGVPVIGFQTDNFPAFYSRSSGLKVSMRADSAEEAAKIAKTHWEMGLKTGILLAVPIPEDVAMQNDVVEAAVTQALQEATSQQVRGQEVTPFLLRRVVDLTGGRSLQANLRLLTNNARVAAQVARFLHGDRRGKIA